MIEQIFREEGVPDELKYLAMIEGQTEALKNLRSTGLDAKSSVITAKITECKENIDTLVALMDAEHGEPQSVEF